MDSRVAAARPQKFTSVQVLRGLAALMVVFYHLPAPLGAASPFLNAGVDIFFVISGFVMVASTQNAPRDAGMFLLQRFIRIVPLYWILTFVMAGTLWLVMGRLVSSEELVRSLFFIPYRDDISSFVQPVLGVGWTLNLEILFYLLFAFTLALGATRQMLLIGAVFAAAVVLRVVLKPADDTVLFFYTTPILFEFLAGMALGHLAVKVRQLPLTLGLACALLALVAFAAMAIDPSMPRIIAQGVPAALLVAACLRLEDWFRTIGSRSGLAQLGDASYSLYLVHVPVLLVVAPVIVVMHMAQWLGATIAIAACVAAALVCYRLIEQPLLALLRPRPIVRPARA
jgi:exopolysaccharide production protein ExoZ